MENDTFIDKLIAELQKYNSDTIASRIEAFEIYGEYLNQIPNEYHTVIIEDLSSAIYLYCMGIDEFCSFQDYKPNNATTQPAVSINQDIKTLKKAIDIIHNKFFYRYFKFTSTPIPTKENPTQEERDKQNQIYDETLRLHQNADRIDIIEDTITEKKVFNAYCTLYDMINDLQNKEFKIFLKEQYYPFKKPNKNQIKEILQAIRKQFNIKASHHENQLIAAL